VTNTAFMGYHLSCKYMQSQEDFGLCYRVTEAELDTIYGK